MEKEMLQLNNFELSRAEGLNILEWYVEINPSILTEEQIDCVKNNNLAIQMLGNSMLSLESVVDLATGDPVNFDEKLHEVSEAGKRILDIVSVATEVKIQIFPQIENNEILSVVKTYSTSKIVALVATLESNFETSCIDNFELLSEDDIKKVEIILADIPTRQLFGTDNSILDSREDEILAQGFSYLCIRRLKRNLSFQSLIMPGAEINPNKIISLIFSNKEMPIQAIENNIFILSKINLLASALSLVEKDVYNELSEMIGVIDLEQLLLNVRSRIKANIDSSEIDARIKPMLRLALDTK